MLGWALPLISGALEMDPAFSRRPWPHALRRDGPQDTQKEQRPASNQVALLACAKETAQPGTLHAGGRAPGPATPPVAPPPPLAPPLAPPPRPWPRPAPLLQAVPLLRRHPGPAAAGARRPLGPLPPPVGGGVHAALQAVGCGAVVLGDKPHGWSEGWAPGRLGTLDRTATGRATRMSRRVTEGTPRDSRGLEV